MPSHTRRMETEEKAKVVTVWGEEFIKFLAALAVLPRTILNDRPSFKVSNVVLQCCILY